MPQSRPRVVRSLSRVYYSKASTEYRALLVVMFRALYYGKPISEPVAVQCVFSGLKVMADLDNALKLVLDALVEAGVLQGDSISIVRSVRALAVLEEEPYMRVVVEAI